MASTGGTTKYKPVDLIPLEQMLAPRDNRMSEEALRAYVSEVGGKPDPAANVQSLLSALDEMSRVVPGMISEEEARFAAFRKAHPNLSALDAMRLYQAQTNIDDLASKAGSAGGLYDTVAGKRPFDLAQVAGDAWNLTGDPLINLAMDRYIGPMAQAFLPEEKTLLSVFDTWHGTPHRFPAERRIQLPDGTQTYVLANDPLPEGAKVLEELPLGRFRMDRVGTGEGAQAFGHGLYTAEDPGFAKSFRDSNKFKNAIDVEGEARSLGLELNRDAQVEFLRQAKEPNDPMQAARQLQWANASTRNMPVEKLAELVDRYRKSVEGSLYKVQIDAEPEDFLDWSLRLSEQPDVAKKLGFSLRTSDEIHDEADALFAKYGQYPDMPPEIRQRLEELQNELNNRVPNMTGEQFYSGNSENDYLHSTLSGRRFTKEQSDALREKGIPGIRYTDQGYKNYVLFDDRLMKILDREGEPKPSKVLQLGTETRTGDVSPEGDAPVRIKLGAQPERTNNTEDFMDALWEQSQEHPYDRRSRILGDASIEVSPFEDAIHISDIRSLAPKSGAGTAALKRLIEMADMYGVPLEGTAKAYHGDNRYIGSSKRLAQWYKKHGFEVMGGDEDSGFDIRYIPNSR